LQWARESLRGITTLRGKARRGEMELSLDDSERMLRIQRELLHITGEGTSTDPTTWVVPDG
jgi:hypothetical protein